MANVPFEREKDRVTEREMVYDIVERLKIGRDLKYKDNPNIYLGYAGDYLLDLFQRFAQAIPDTVLANLDTLKTTALKISAGTKGNTTTILNANSILMAFSESTGMDVGDVLTVTKSGSNLVVALTAEVNYNKDDTIKIYTI